MESVDTVASTVQVQAGPWPDMPCFLGCYAEESGRRTTAILAQGMIEETRCFHSEMGLLLPSGLHR
jgi:hypothetical protein